MNTYKGIFWLLIIYVLFSFIFNNIKHDNSDSEFIKFGVSINNKVGLSKFLINHNYKSENEENILDPIVELNNYKSNMDYRFELLTTEIQTLREENNRIKRALEIQSNRVSSIRSYGTF